LTGPPDPASGHGPLHVLLVEDSEDDALLIRRELERSGLAVTSSRVDDADSLRAALDEAQWDVVLSDHAIPGFGGFEALALLRERDPDAPFIIVSGAIGEEVAVAAMKAGANDYVPKDMLGRLAPVIDRERRAARVRAAERRAAEALRRSEARHRAILETTREWIWSCDPAGVIIESSGPTEQMLGYARDELIGLRAVDLMYEEDRDLVLSAMARCREELCGSSRIVARFRPKDGGRRVLEGSFVPIVDDGGAHVGFWGADRDVTAEVEAEERIRRQAERARSLAELAAMLAERAGDVGAIAELAARRAVEVMGDGCAILIADNEGILRAIAVDHRDPEAAEYLRTTVDSHPPSATVGISARVIRDGRPVLLSPLSEDDLRYLDSAGYRDFRTRLGLSGMIVAPMRVGVGAAGVFVLSRNRGPDYTDEDLEFAQELAHQVATALRNARILAALRETDRQRRMVLGQLVRAQEEERRRVAADIHDDSIQVMSAVAFRLDALEDALTEPREREMLEALRDSVRQAIGRLRRLLVELRPPSLDQAGLVPAIRQYLERMASETGVRVALSNDLSRDPPPDVRVIAYRIVQEALTNARKHAGATSVRVGIAHEGQGLRLVIADDGVGFSPDRWAEKPGHIGLSTMRERAEVAGGRLQIWSAEGSGTTVECWLPVAAPEGDEG
jgi:PAS domain S-box-containing protein